MSEKRGFIITCLKWITSAIGIVTVLFLILTCTLGRVSYSSKDIGIIDSTKVTITTQAAFKGKYNGLIRDLFKKNSIPSDSAKIAVIEVVTRLADGEPSNNEVLNRVEQFYYNTHDKLLGTLAILLSVFSILIAFFGGLIPYLRSSKAEEQLNRIKRNMELQKKSADRQLKEISAKLKESKDTATKLSELKSDYCTFVDGYENRIQKLIDIGKRIRKRVTKIGETYFELISTDESAAKLLKEYVDSTEMLETLGENLDKENYLLRALYYQIIKDEEAFQNEFSICTKLDNTTSPYLTVAATYVLMDMPKTSIAYCDQAISIDRESSRSWFLKGLAHSGNGLQRDAINCFNEAINLQSDYVEAFVYKGVALRQLELPEDAIKCYEEAIRIKPDYDNAWYNKGYTLDNMGKPDEAINCYAEAIRITQDNAEAWISKGVALEKMDQLAEAVKCYDKAIHIEPESIKALRNKGALLVKMKQIEEGIRCFDEAVMLNPLYAESWYNKGIALVSNKRPGAAIKCFDEAIRLQPGYAYAWFGNSSCYAMLEMKGMMMESLTTTILLDVKLKDRASKDAHFKAYWEDPDFKKLVE
ncbi:MAG: tetratricopeptide repeat protein [Candidatus Cloacimonetes bacterium]|nr:tetratricopeptide repeat protein [Candidatus Cloacimonadota bacterium]